MDIRTLFLKHLAKDKEYQIKELADIVNAEKALFDNKKIMFDAIAYPGGIGLYPDFETGHGTADNMEKAIKTSLADFKKKNKDKGLLPSWFSVMARIDREHMLVPERFWKKYSGGIGEFKIISPYSRKITRASDR